MKLVQALGAMMVLVSCQPMRIAPPGELFGEVQLQIRRGEIRQALEACDRAIGRHKLTPESPWYWQFRVAKGHALTVLGQADAAEELLSVPVPEGEQFREAEARRRMELAFAHYRRARLPEAAQWMERAAALVKPEEAALLAEIETRAGAIYSARGDGKRADESLRQGYEHARAANDVYLQALSMGNLGFHYMNLARYDQAVEWFERAVSLFNPSLDVRVYGKTTGNLGWSYSQLGETEKALPMLLEAEKVAVRIGDKLDQQVWLGAVGGIHFGNGELGEARRYYDRALEVSRSIKAEDWTLRWLRYQTRVALAAGDPERAGKYNGEARALAARLAEEGIEVEPQLDAARVLLARGEGQQARRMALEATSRLGGLAAETLFWEGHSIAARASEKLGEPEQADRHYRVALESIAQNTAALAREDWKFSRQADLMETLHDYIDFLMKRGESERALEVAEWSKARVLRERLGILETGMTRHRSGDYRAMARQAGATVLCYWLGSRRSWVWVVTPGKVTAVELPAEREIASQVEAYTTALIGLRDPVAHPHPAGQWLWRNLVEPLRKNGLPPSGGRVIVVPHGPLYRLNLETLPDGGTPSRYWLEEMTLQVVPSLNILLHGSRAGERARSGSLLLVGDPVPVSPEFPELQHSARELREIAALYDGLSPVVRQRERAHREVLDEVDADRFRYMHWSAHAAVNQENPLESAIILSPGKGGGYKLYARDLMQAPVRAELVSISACRSAGVRPYSGEGLVGFSWAFLQAGARNVVAGLWDVNDRASAELMIHLYRHLRSGVSPAVALREAKRELIRAGGAWQKPYYWGAFQVYSRTGVF
jgi:CHAT domain-containing protein/Tfp pilus assembly protein PilF